MKRVLVAMAPALLAACAFPAADKQSDAAARAFYAEVRTNAGSPGARKMPSRSAHCTASARVWIADR